MWALMKNTNIQTPSHYVIPFKLQSHLYNLPCFSPKPAAIFKDGRHTGTKLHIQTGHHTFSDHSDTWLPKNQCWICSPFWYPLSVWLMDYFT